MSNYHNKVAIAFSYISEMWRESIFRNRKEIIRALKNHNLLEHFIHFARTGTIHPETDFWLLNRCQEDIEEAESGNVIYTAVLITLRSTMSGYQFGIDMAKGLVSGNSTIEDLEESVKEWEEKWDERDTGLEDEFNPADIDGIKTQKRPLLYKLAKEDLWKYEKVEAFLDSLEEGHDPYKEIKELRDGIEDLNSKIAELESEIEDMKIG